MRHAPIRSGGTPPPVLPLPPRPLRGQISTSIAAIGRGRLQRGGQARVRTRALLRWPEPHPGPGARSSSHPSLCPLAQGSAWARLPLLHASHPSSPVHPSRACCVPLSPTPRCSRHSCRHPSPPPWPRPWHSAPPSILWVSNLCNSKFLPSALRWHPFPHVLGIPPSPHTLRPHTLPTLAAIPALAPRGSDSKAGHPLTVAFQPW